MTRPSKQTNPVNTLPFFPAGFPDETLGSRVSRYHIRRGQPPDHATYHELFGRPPFSLTPLVQSHLDKLAIRLPGTPVENLRRLQDQSTLLPLFRRFFGTQTTQRRVVGNAVAAIELPKRLVGGSRLTHLCAECLADDEKVHGCRYLHRSHQIPGVTVCWKHGLPLIDLCPSCRQPFAQPNQLILSAWMGCECGRNLAVAPESVACSTSTELEFARFAKALLAESQIALTAEQLVEVYRERSIKLGFTCGGHRIKRKALFAEIEAFYGTDLLAKVDPSYRKSKTSGWFHVLQSSLTIEAPLYRHLLFSFYLFREPGAFLRSIEDVARTASSCNAGRQSGPVATEKPAADILMDEMIEVARRNGYDSQKLWHHCVGSMKRLVRYLPDACRQIDARLHEESSKKKRDAIKLLKSTERDRLLDPQWADAIVKNANAIYRKETRPFRVTMNQLVKTASFRPKNISMPKQESTPLARAAAESHAESTWHFYARRLLWTLQALEDPATTFHTIIKLAGLEVYKAREVFNYFDGVRRCGGPSIQEIMQILASRGVGRNWIGPCPEKTFYRAGRAYKLRTSRRGPIGGRAGDAEPIS
ncbi:TnsD family Tn7-like transposition protein [Massilia genomosp. 1]|uniref:Transposon Tn7 transposition protein TnsD C-termianl domain-containing protein n=1 Tax=Massilia genomosp. 1 TaxID=2609280 RepID=A0ABX0MHZ6_9BURK|nr:TnsD family Tn7-like transposition protein [Massilia genomosp. 1]NHZ62363.1 hypothetical protein [Massilia genomosp. 1]